MPATERFGFGLEFGYPALFMLLIAAAPSAVYSAFERFSPDAREWLAANPAAGTTCQFLVHSWGVFFLIIACVIFTIGTLQVLFGARMRGLTTSEGSH